MKALLAIILTVSCIGASCQPPSPPPLHSWPAIMESSMKRIQSGDSSDIGFTVYEIAAVWTAAGFIQQANLLLSRLWSYHIVDLEEFRNLNDCFPVMWALSGKRPDHIPFRVKLVTEIVQENWDGLFNYFPGFMPVVPDSIRSKPWTELSGHALAAKARLLSFDEQKPHHREARSAQETAVLAFSRYFAADPERLDLQDAAIAAVVSAGLGQGDNAKKFIRQFGIGFLRLPQYLVLADLLKDTASARYLLRGALAPVWGITDSSCTEDLQKVEALLSRRISAGPSLVFGQLTLRALLQRLSDRAISKNDLNYDQLALGSHWLGYPPAQEARITATEKRLGINLPDDYKTFLRVTNGFKATSNVGVSFLSIDSIGWLRNLDAELAEIWGQPMSDGDSVRAIEFRRALLIGGFGEEQQFLLIPPVGEDKEWKYWFFATWTPGITAYPSLRFYIEHEMQFLMDH